MSRLSYKAVLREVADRAAPESSGVAACGSDCCRFLARCHCDLLALHTKLGIKLVAAGIHNAAEVERAIIAVATQPHGGLNVYPHTITEVHLRLIVELAAKYRLPAVFPFRYHAEGGGLLSYGVDALDLVPRAADYVDRIFRDANPGDLPVQAPTKFELVINLQTAKALGLDVSPSLQVSRLCALQYPVNITRGAAKKVSIGRTISGYEKRLEQGLSLREQITAAMRAMSLIGTKLT